MRYLPLTDSEKNRILKACSVDSFDDLIEQVPQDLQLKSPLKIEKSLDEHSLVELMSEISARNKAAKMTSFLGQGAYDHLWPTAIDQLSNRGEFLTAYTPYQPEISQGTLQVIFEYQSMVASLAGFEVSNASLYDGATSVVESVLMAARLQNRTQGTVVVSEGLYDRYSQVLKSYLEPLGFKIFVWNAHKEKLCSLASDLKNEKFTDNPLAVVMQSPNTWGQIEDWQELKTAAQSLNTKSIAVVTHGHSLAKFNSPGSAGIDIACGELQSFGIPVGFGGPYLGMICCQKKDVRQMPGRLVGLTQDSRGQRAFCITLATREQHIRREKATSNICSNQNLMATRACMYLSLMGTEGLLKVAHHSRAHALYVKDSFQKIIDAKKSKISLSSGDRILNEWSLLIPKEDFAFVSRFQNRCEGAGLLGGVNAPSPRNRPEILSTLVLAFTEKHKKRELDRLIQCFEESIK